jgi:low temperature requirement protein LtrA
MATFRTITHRRPAGHVHHDNRGKAVPLELFFDLVFVFGFTQVTQFLSNDPSWIGIGRGLALLGLLWWAWVGYSWLASAADPEEGGFRIAFFVAMAAMFVTALATDEAMGAAAVTFAVAYAVVRVVHAGVFVVVSAHDAAFRRAVMTLVPGFLIAPSLLLIGAFLDGPARGVAWAVALVVDLIGPFLGGSRGWQINPSHFAERHGLIVIIALGEAIVSVGVGAADTVGLSADVVIVAVVAIAIAALFWWAYFDVVAIVAERKLHEAQGVDRNRLARDSYSYLHYFLLAGVVLVALGAKKTAADAWKPLSWEVAVAMGGGAASYFGTLAMLRWRNVGVPNWRRLGAAVILATVVPIVAHEFSGAAGLISIAVIGWAVIVWEAVKLAELRHHVRHHDHELH